ncbi:MAG TPA: type IV pilus assembly protein PilM [Chthoniobacterales bacterium]
MAAPSRLLSLNLGTQTVTLADFASSESGGLILNAYESRDLLFDGASDGAKSAHVTSAITELIHDLKARREKVNLCIPSQSVFTRFVKLPTVDEDKIEQIIGFEAQQNVPFPITEVVWDYQLVGGSDPDRLGVVLVAIKSDLLGEIDASAEQAGLETELVDVAPMALYNAFRYNYENVTGCSLIADIGARTTNLIFVEPQHVFSRSIPIGGQTITTAISKEFQEPLADAENRKKRDGFVGLGGSYAEPDDPDVARVSKIIRNTMTRLHMEIVRSISFYRSQQAGSQPVRMYLAGGSANLVYMKEFFHEKMQLPVEYFNPLKNVPVGPSVDVEKVGREAHSLGELVGTTLRKNGECPIELNLLPPELVRRQEMAKRKPYLVGAGFILLLLLAGWWLYFKQATEKITEVTDKVVAETSRLQSFDSKFKAIDKRVKEETTRIAPILEAIARREVWVRLIDDINQRLPEEKIWVTAMEPLQFGKPLSFGDVKAITAQQTATPSPTRTTPASKAIQPKPGVAPLANAATGPVIDQIILKGLYIENSQVVDQFFTNLLKSPFFEIDPTKKNAVITVRKDVDSSAWAFDYELTLPLKEPISLK